MFTGTFVHGLREGCGTEAYADGSTCEGRWLKGVKEGSGRYRGATGLAYDGPFAGGKATDASTAPSFKASALQKPDQMWPKFCFFGVARTSFRVVVQVCC